MQEEKETGDPARRYEQVKKKKAYEKEKMKTNEEGGRGR